MQNNKTLQEVLTEVYQNSKSEFPIKATDQLVNYADMLLNEDRIDEVRGLLTVIDMDQTAAQALTGMFTILHHGKFNYEEEFKESLARLMISLKEKHGLSQERCYKLYMRLIDK